jgi:hypothetical protein
MRIKWLGTLPIMVLCAISLAQVRQENRTLVINGRSGEAATAQIDGRTYVDLRALARITEGSLDSHGNQIVLTLPTLADRPPAETHAPEKSDHSALSRDFRMAGIEAIAEMREWATTLAYAIQNGYGVTEAWAGDYREQAGHSVRLATAAASTDADRNALQLLTKEFEHLREWSNKLVEAKKTMDTAKYTLSPNALRDEPLSQKIINCGHFLGTMLGSGDFSDDGSCH